MSRKSKAAAFLDEVYDVVVTGRNVEVTDAMKNYAMEKISKVDRFTNRIINVNIIMDIQKLDHHVDIIVRIDNQKIKVSAHSTDMYASIDMAVDKLTNQIRRHKERVRDHHSIGHADVAMNIDVYSPYIDLLEVNDEIDAENAQNLVKSYTSHRVVKNECRPLKILTIQEAIVKMELSGDMFMVFRSEEDMKLKVIYRRSDSNFGIIEPE